jgi:hypothetical protein
VRLKDEPVHLGWTGSKDHKTRVRLVDPWRLKVTFRCEDCLKTLQFAYATTKRPGDVVKTDERHKRARQNALKEMTPFWMRLPDWDGSELTYLPCLAKSTAMLPGTKKWAKRAFLDAVSKSGGGALLKNVQPYDVILCLPLEGRPQIHALLDPSLPPGRLNVVYSVGADHRVVPNHLDYVRSRS